MKITRHYFFLLILIGFLTSCTQNTGKGGIDDSLEKKIRNQVISIAEDYTSKQLKDAKKTIAPNGIIIMGDEKKRYVIDPSKIFTGLIDDDANEDAIITITSLNGDYLGLIEHLIIINTNGKLMLLRAVESDMKILQLHNRVITAELPTRPRSSPLYNCSACREIVKYQFKTGELIRME